jgi:RNA polymerase sigma-70 factor (ECF subfamily)
MLRRALADQVGPLFSDVFPFGGELCNRIADAVVSRLRKP